MESSPGSLSEKALDAAQQIKSRVKKGLDFRYPGI